MIQQRRALRKARNPEAQLKDEERVLLAVTRLSPWRPGKLWKGEPVALNELAAVSRLRSKGLIEWRAGRYRRTTR